MRRWIQGRHEPSGSSDRPKPSDRPKSAGRSKPSDRPERETGVPLRLVQGDTYASWEAIYLDNVHRIYRLMFSKVGNRPDAEDLTAEVFLTVLRPLRTTATVGEVRAYLLATARTVLAAHWRRTFGREITAIDVEQVAAEYDRPAEDTRSAQRVERILAGLPGRYRRVLELLNVFKNLGALVIFLVDVTCQIISLFLALGVFVDFLIGNGSFHALDLFEHAEVLA